MIETSIDQHFSDRAKKMREQHDKLALEYLRNPKKFIKANDYKYAYVFINSCKIMVMIDILSKNQTAYYLKSDCPERTDKEVEKYTFIRWCTGFDL